jgi:hypothetical protein
MECTQIGLDGQSAASPVALERGIDSGIAPILHLDLEDTTARGMATTKKKSTATIRNVKV